MPHFRAQMNAVPGAITQFTFVPTITTDSMRTLLNDPEFNYVLLCNKVCGSAHYNMQMTIVVEKQAQYEQWIAEQKTFVQSEEEENTEGAPEVEVVEEESQVAVN
jgi:cytochrome c oxidase subunit 2